jgi:O-acetylhomoserine/O-acetylserine sulfhydrylase-like pyridoxal-dependent enzyme
VGAGRRVRASLRGWLTTACVRLVEKKVAKLDGVTATVNLATGVARVSHPALAIGSARTPLISGTLLWCGSHVRD